MKVYCNDCKHFKNVKVGYSGCMGTSYAKRCTENKQKVIRHTAKRPIRRFAYDNYREKNSNNDCSAYKSRPKPIKLGSHDPILKWLKKLLKAT